MRKMCSFREKRIYEQFIEKCNVVYVTKMDAEFVADKHFPNLDESDLFLTRACGGGSSVSGATTKTVSVATKKTTPKAEASH